MLKWQASLWRSSRNLVILTVAYGQNRLGELGAAISSSTFHSFGLRVIGEATGRKPSVPDDLAGSDNKVGRLSRIVDALRDQDTDFRRDWNLFRVVFGIVLPDLGDEPDPKAVDRRRSSKEFRTLAGRPTGT